MHPVIERLISRYGWRPRSRASGIWAAMLVISGILLILPFLWSRSIAFPEFAWAPGYWEPLPKIGLTRIIPIASPKLVSPAVNFRGISIRQEIKHN